MHIKKTILILVCFAFSSYAAYVQHDGKWCDARYVPELSLTEHYDLGYRFFQEHEWFEAQKNFLTILTHFLDSPFQADVIFYSGVCYYFMDEYDLANRQFDRYLKTGSSLTHLETAFEYKLHIADRYASKATRKYPMGLPVFPKLKFSSKDEAISIYDEIVAALPSHELAVKALFGKGKLFMKKQDHKECIEVLQALARRFPKHSLAAESYLLISEVYLRKSLKESQNPDICSLAQINLRKFKEYFPGDERSGEAEENLRKMERLFAGSLYDTGRYYERKKKPKASVIYYQEAIKRFPETDYAKKCALRVKELEPAVAQK